MRRGWERCEKGGEHDGGNIKLKDTIITWISFTKKIFFFEIT